MLRLSESEAETAEPSAPERMIITMGPQHPSTHGVLRLLLARAGETVTRC
ncbi:MAG: NADH-quinone oxidoreductase subunit D, partial [bacterium]|nr:NADH-quinone oxidoreductase subunit D [bacterium]